MNRQCIDCEYVNIAPANYPCNACGISHRNYKEAKSEIRPADTNFSREEQRELLMFHNDEVMEIRGKILNAFECAGLFVR